MATLLGGFPGDGSEGALEEGIVDDVALVVFAFDDPVSGVGFAMAAVGEDGGGMSALRGIYEKRSAGTKGVHFNYSWQRCSANNLYFTPPLVKKA